VFKQRLENTGIIRFTPQRSGFYQAVCQKEGETSESADFAVVSIDAVFTEPPAPGCTLRLKYNLCNDDVPIGCTIIDKRKDYKHAKTPCSCRIFNADEIDSHTIELAPLTEGSYRLNIMARNKYGIYAKPLHFEIEP